MNFDLYADDSKGIIRLDPRTKLFIFLVSGVLSLNSFHMVSLIIYGTILCAILALCGKPVFALWSYILLLIGIYVRHFVILQGSVVPLTVSIVSSLIVIVLVSFPMVMSFYLLSQTTRISQLMAAFKAMHFPAKVIIPIAVIFRFIPSVSDEWAGIRKAMAFCGVSMEPMSIVKAPFKIVEYILVPLLFSSVAVMEEMAAAALARGIDSDGKRSSYEEVKLRLADYIVMSTFVLLIIYVFTIEKAGL